ncbi:hypothetical protein R6Q59_007202 [Mikania micrantha]
MAHISPPSAALLRSSLPSQHCIPQATPTLIYSPRLAPPKPFIIPEVNKIINSPLLSLKVPLIINNKAPHRLNWSLVVFRQFKVRAAGKRFLRSGKSNPKRFIVFKFMMLKNQSIVYGLTADANSAYFFSHAAGVKVIGKLGVTKHINFKQSVKFVDMIGDKLYCGCSGFSIQEIKGLIPMKLSSEPLQIFKTQDAWLQT